MIPLQMLRDSLSSYRELRLADFEIWDTLETLHSVVHLSHTCSKSNIPIFGVRQSRVNGEAISDIFYLHYYPAGILNTVSPAQHNFEFCTSIASVASTTSCYRRWGIHFERGFSQRGEILERVR